MLSTKFSNKGPIPIKFSFHPWVASYNLRYRGYIRVGEGLKGLGVMGLWGLLWAMGCRGYRLWVIWFYTYIVIRF